MVSMLNINQTRTISQIIINDIVPGFYDERRTIFLVGASLSDSRSMRSRLKKVLDKYNSIKVYFPEQIFDEAIYSSGNDLLSLENLLATSVDNVVLCVESPGSFTELGAFVNHDKLRNRLTVIMDQNKKKAKSFINLGPIKSLTKENKQQVIWHNFKDNNVARVARQIRQRLKSLGPNQDINKSLINPIIAEQFLLTTLYVMGSVNWGDIVTLIKTYGFDNSESFITMTNAALSSLFYQRFIFLRNGRYFLKSEGILRLNKLMITNYKKNINLLDNLRIEILNLQLRNKKEITWQRIS